MRRAKPAKEVRFDRYARRRLAAALRRATDIRTYRRGPTVLLMAQGRSVPDIAQITGTRPWSIYNWARRYRGTLTADGLADAARPGRPRAAPAITDARIVRAFRRDPLRLGYSTTGWTVALLAEHLSRRY